MRNRFLALLMGFNLLLAAANAQSSKNFAVVPDLEHISFTVEEAPEWSALFVRDSGWFGADGIYSIPVNGNENRQTSSNGKVMMIFSDSMIGQIANNTMQDGYTMIHNSVAVLNGNKPDSTKLKFFWRNTAGKPESVFLPTTPQTQKGDYFWLGDGFVNQEMQNALYIFGYRVRNVSDGPFGFKEVGNTIIKVPSNSMPPYDHIQQMDTPFYLTDKDGDIGSFGAGIYVNTKKAGAPRPDGYVYVYGVRGKTKNLMAARVLPKDFEQFGLWQFWNGSAWTNDISKASDITDHVSNELSLTALPDGRYALIFQVGGLSTTVGMRLGASPVGPFGPIIKLWDCKKDMEEHTFLAYNAKAHPSLSAPNELLISYNINSLEFIKDLKVHPHLYRPRFIRVKFSN